MDLRELTSFELIRSIYLHMHEYWGTLMQITLVRSFPYAFGHLTHLGEFWEPI